VADRPDVRALIDALLRGEKALVGYGMWQPGNRDGCYQWSSAVEFLGEISGARVEVKAYTNHDELKFRILLNEQRCIWRLDFANDDHTNPLTAPEAPAQAIAGPHYHPWADNRRYATMVSLPRRLRNARILPADIRTFDAAFRWFCSEVRISIKATDVPKLPGRDVLL
jgi:hypothetical protein